MRIEFAMLGQFVVTVGHVNQVLDGESSPTAAAEHQDLRRETASEFCNDVVLALQFSVGLLYKLTSRLYSTQSLVLS